MDLTLMKVGAYGDIWLDIHMNPESAVQAQLDLRGKTLLPVHWATFDLSYHTWNEPILRTLLAAKDKGVFIITLRVGEKFEFGQSFHYFYTMVALYKNRFAFAVNGKFSIKCYHLNFCLKKGSWLLHNYDLSMAFLSLNSKNAFDSVTDFLIDKKVEKAIKLPAKASFCSFCSAISLLIKGSNRIQPSL